MSVRKIGRILGLGLVLVGVLVLGYAGLNFFQITNAQRSAEAQAPAVDSGTITPLPTLAAKAALPSPTATATQVPSPTDVPPSSTPEPSSTPAPTDTPQPTATPTIPMVVGAAGLPKGQGASPVRIVIPRINRDIRVQEATWAVVNENGQQVSEWQIPYDAVAHLTITARPGEAGNAVISGHNNETGPNIPGVGLFAYLWNIKPGDPIYVTDSVGRTFLYQMQKYYILQEVGVSNAVRVQHAQQLLADDGTPVLTLETCWNGTWDSLWGNTYRWVVVSRLVGTVDAAQIPSVKN